MRDINVVLRDILAVEGLHPGLGPALAGLRESAAYAAPERSRPLWDEASLVLRDFCGIPPRGEPERRAWAVFTDRPVEDVPAAAAAGEAGS